MSMSYRYQKLNSVDKGEFYTAAQFRKPKVEVPVKSIAISCVLTFVGLCLVVVGALLVSGRIDTAHRDSTWPVLILGLITLVPGFYHLRIAVYTYLNYPGFSYEDIPTFND